MRLREIMSSTVSSAYPMIQALPPGPDNLITRATIEAELVQQLDVGPTLGAQLLTAILATVAESVSPGQMEDVRGQLPEELRVVFRSAPSSASS